MKCLQKEPHLRYGSAHDLSEDLHRFLRKEPILARPVGVVGRTWRWCRRRPAVAALLATLVVVVLGSLAGLASLWLLAEDRADRADRRRTEAEDSLLRGLRAMDESFRKISEEALLNAEGMQPLRKQLLESHLKYYQEFLAQRADDPNLRAEVAQACSRVGTILQVLGQFPEARAALQSARDRFSQLVQACPDEPMHRLRLAECNGDLSRVYFQMGEFEPSGPRRLWKQLWKSSSSARTTPMSFAMAPHGYPPAFRS